MCCTRVCMSKVLTGKLAMQQYNYVPLYQVTPEFNTEMATAPQDQSAGDGGYQTVVIAVLAIALLGTAAGWIVTCVVAWRRSSIKFR